MKILNKNLLQNLSIVIISTIIATLLLEIIMRLLSLDYLGIQPLHDGTSLQLKRGEFIASQTLGYVPCENNYGRGVYGFQEVQEYSISKEKNTFRIVVIGDSIIQSCYLSRALKEFLKEGAKHKYEIWNVGIGGYNTLQECFYIKYKGMLVQPDMIILGYCLNDINKSSVAIPRGKEYEMYWTRFDPLASYTPFLFKNFFLYRYIWIRVLQKRRVVDKSFPEAISKETLENELVRTYNMLKKRGIPFIIMIFPKLQPLSEYNELDKYSYRSILDIVKKHKLEYLDLTNIFHSLGTNEIIIYKGDFFHPNLYANKVAAKNLLKYLKKEYPEQF